MFGPVTCKSEEDSQNIINALELPQHLSNYNSLDLFFKCLSAAYSTVKGQIWPKFKIVRDTMVFLVTTQNKEIESKLKPLDLPLKQLIPCQWYDNVKF